MRPDRTNYEIWLVDYLDGTLDTGRQRELLLFLDENPDIREELSDMLKYRIIQPVEKFSCKNSLKKTQADLSESQFELLCVAASENDITEDQKSELDEIIDGNPEKRKIAEQIRRIKLVPPLAEYRYKSRLKKLTLPQKIIRYSVISISAAAAILVLVTILRNPVLTVPDNQLLATSNDTVHKESVTTHKPENFITRQPELVADNVNHAAAKKDHNIQEGIKSDNQAILVSEKTETASSLSFIRNSEISKIDYSRSVSLSNNEISRTLVAINLIPVPDIPEEERPGLNESITRFFREKIFKSETKEKGSLKGYEIADAGINGLNRLFGWEMSLEKKTDEKGEVNSVYFNSRLLKFNAPVKKSEPLE